MKKLRAFKAASNATDLFWFALPKSAMVCDWVTRFANPKVP
jgi:hypothetical protein